MIKTKTENRKVCADKFLNPEDFGKTQNPLSGIERPKDPGNKKSPLDEALKFLRETEETK